ncbi:hypothetical protein K438DRAFT_1765272 [Mycena galopus ATCC 62051]|nr:hypothetical protein K438DRAFT_1765272 [Mycena galopus ATCC 62051]
MPDSALVRWFTWAFLHLSVAQKQGGSSGWMPSKTSFSPSVIFPGGKVATISPCALKTVAGGRRGYIKFARGRRSHFSYGRQNKVKGDEGVPPPPPPPAHDNDGAAAASGDKGDKGGPPPSLPPAHDKDYAAAASADEGAIPPPPPSGNSADADDEKADTNNRGAPAPPAKVKRGRKGAVKKTAGPAAKKSAPKNTVPPPTPKKRGRAKETDEDVTEDPPTKWCRVPGGPAVAAARQAHGLVPSPKKRKAIES